MKYLQANRQWLWLLPVCLPWLTSLAGPFQFDDFNVIVNYSPVHSFSAWLDAQPGIRPLLKLSYTANWTLSPSPFGFHLFNLLVHLLNTALLYRWLSTRLPLDARMAGLVTLLWALHPVQSEAVTYIAGRSVSLSTTFLLCGLLLLDSRNRRRAISLGLVTLAGLAVRETSWIFPLVFLLVTWMQGRGGKAALRMSAPAWLAVALVLPVLIFEPHYRHLLDVSFSTRDLNAQWLTQMTAWRYFLTGLVFTLTPNIDPALIVPPHWTTSLIAQAILLKSVLLFCLWQMLARRNWMAAGVVWFFLLLFPVNGVIPRLDVANDRHLYPALIGPAWALGLALSRWQAGYVVMIGLVVVFSIGLLIRNEDYRSNVALWHRTAQQSPDKSRVWNNLGYACQQAVMADCARNAYREALRLDPTNTKAAVNLYFLERQANPAASGKSASSPH